MTSYLCSFGLSAAERYCFAPRNKKFRCSFSFFLHFSFHPGFVFVFFVFFNPLSYSYMATANNPTAATEEGSSVPSTIHPIPCSIIIVNEATPLLSSDQQLASGTLHTDTSFHFSFCIALSSDEQQREVELSGLFLLLISSLLFTGVSVIVKLLGVTFPSFEIVLGRALIQLPLGLLGCCVARVNPVGKKGVRKWILFRSLVSAIALSLFFYSLTKLPLIDATGSCLCVTYSFIYLSNFLFLQQ
jgi:hypothetical protein